MMGKEKLRKADAFSGVIIFLFGLWIISQALKMPMKDSWGGVQDVWFVSPALFPMFVGAMIMLLGLLLIRSAVKSVGLKELGSVFRRLIGPDLIRYLQADENWRFYAVVLLFFSYVYLEIPRVDFFLCSVLFLVVLISMFYFDDDVLLKKMFFFYAGGTLFFILYFAFGLPAAIEPVLPYASDWLTLVFIFIYCIYIWKLVRRRAELRKKYMICLVLALATPFLIGPIFKYFLLVPMPQEGLVVNAMDALRYSVF
jgi:hypothetical protein